VTGTPDPNAAFEATVAANAGGARPPLARGESIGRYVVLDFIGGGGMGVVYGAYDPQLDRRIAIKLLRARPAGERATTDGHARLLREAQAIARISHPNVIAVHDVGSIGDEIFVAMEYVEGETLHAWCEKETRTPEAILAMYLQAGRGLAAAHARGVVHRDFKPDNVLVATDGRARVLDFGLAHSVRDGHALADTRPLLRDSASGPSLPSLPNLGLDTPLTRTGDVMGTPLYMAPEQFLGKPTDARTDQYSFSLALLEALHGEHPISQSGDVRAFVHRVMRGELRPDPPDRKLPARLRRALARGMAVDPAERFQSMNALLTALAPPRRSSVWRWSLALAGATTVGAVAAAWASHRAGPTPGAMCRAGGQELAGVWDGARRRSVSEAFLRTSKPYARDALRSTEAALDDYAQTWARMHEDACLATKVRGEQSEELLDLRMACLGQRREELRALVDTLVSADDAVVERAVQAAQSLSDLHACEDVTALRSPDAPPRDAAIRARIEAVRARLARARALDAEGKYSDLLKVTEAASADAATIGFRPLVAAAQLELGRARHAVGDVPRARDAVFSAAVAAEASRDDVVAAQAWIELTNERGCLSRFGEAHEADRLATAAIDRLRGDDLLTARRELTLGAVLHMEGHYEEALAAYRDSLDKTSRILGEGNLENADVLEAMAKALRELGRIDEAIATYQRALDILQRALGPDHPRVARLLASTSLAFGDKGDNAASLDYAQRALALSERVLDPDSPELAARLIDVANALDANGRSEAAIAAYQRALSLREKALGPDDTGVSDVDFDLAIVFEEQGRAAEALPFARRALAIREKAYAATHPEVGAALTVLGTALCGQKQYAQAAALQQRALAIAEKAFGPDHVQTAEALEALGQARIGLHDATGAVAVLERAYAIFEKLHEYPSERGECAFALARALWDSGGDRARALELAAKARSLCAENGQAAATLAEVERWLALHGAPAGR